MWPTINLLILNVMPLLYTNTCNFTPNLNIFKKCSAIQTLEYDFFGDITLIFAKRNNIFP